MSRKNLLLTIAALMMITTSAISLQSAPVWAQGTGTPVAKAGGFSLKIKIVGVVQTITATQITLTDGTIIELKGLRVPTTVKVGKTATIFAEVEDNELVAKRIAAGGTAASPAARPTGTPEVGPTEDATPEGTQEACGDAEDQSAAAQIAVAFNVPVSEVLRLHCQGIGFGDIARAYLVARLSANGASPLSVAQILDMRQAGQSWSQIIAAAGINPRDLRTGVRVKIEVENEVEIEVEVEDEHQRRGRGSDDKGGDDQGGDDGGGDDNSSDDRGGDDHGGSDNSGKGGSGSDSGGGGSDDD